MNIILSPSTLPAFNLAAEEYLFSKLGEDFLFFYINNSSVIIGSNQSVLNEVDQDFCIEHNIRVIRRISGGGAVYHDLGNINYSFIHDRTNEPLSAGFLEPIVTVLHLLNIPAEIGKRKDLWLNGYKISGTASHLSKGRELHHGTLLYKTNIEMLWGALTSEKRDLIKKATQSVVSPVKNISDYQSENNGVIINTEEFFQQFIEKLIHYYKLNDLSDLKDYEIEEIESLQKSKYSNREWNYRK